MFIIEKEPKSINAESYRTLRTNVQYSNFSKEIKSILITSAECGAGKTTICGNTALAFSQDEKKVILIDCDLRTPDVHNKFKIPNKYGISDILSGIKKFPDIVYKYNDNLDILTSGKIPSNPSEMLGSKAMKSFIEELKKSYDYVILDSSPINVVSDPQLLSTIADGTIIVVKKNETKIDEVKQAKELLQKVGATIIGCVFNCVDSIKNTHKKYYTDNEDAILT